MDTIVLLDSGKVADFGSYEEVRLRSAGPVKPAAATFNLSGSVSGSIDEVDDEPTSKAPKVSGIEDDEMATQEANLSRQNGSWLVYNYYAKSAGASIILFSAFFPLVGAVAANIIRKSN